MSWKIRDSVPGNGKKVFSSRSTLEERISDKYLFRYSFSFLWISQPQKLPAGKLLFLPILTSIHIAAQPQSESNP